MASRTLLSPAQKVNWNTPIKLFTSLDCEFHFTIDIAADSKNYLCDRYFSEENSFFDIQPGTLQNEVLWCNPPYGRNLTKWLKTVTEHVQKGNNKCVMLLPARTDTQWFHQYVYMRAGVRVHFIEGRLKFQDPDTGLSQAPAAFPSCLIYFKPDQTAPFRCGSFSVGMSHD